MISFTFGKHKGEDIREVPVNYLNWVVESFSPGKVRDIAQVELDRRQGFVVNQEKPHVRTGAKAKKTWQESMRDTHYSWQHPGGRVFKIPNEIEMASRDAELCPF